MPTLIEITASQPHANKEWFSPVFVRALVRYCMPKLLLTHQALSSSCAWWYCGLLQPIHWSMVWNRRKFLVDIEVNIEFLKFIIVKLFFIIWDDRIPYFKVANYRFKEKKFQPFLLLVIEAKEDHVCLLKSLHKKSYHLFKFVCKFDSFKNS